jgi:ribonuclease D
VPRWIDTPAPLNALHDTLVAAASADNAPVIGLDTEFVRERTYWPQLALVQISTGQIGADDDGILLVDPLCPGVPEALAAILADTRILKVMHSAGEDLVAFGHTCKALPEPLFDTQVAAALTGVGAGLGYQRILLELLGVNVDKGETRSDWLRRPLSESQLHYAADDVRHLHALHRELVEKLDLFDRMPWLEEDCARMLANAAQDDGDRWPHLGMRSAQFLDRDGQVRLLRLLRWRETCARDHDRPRSWILDNELAAGLARTPPRDLADLQRAFDASPKAPRKLAAQILAAVQTPLPDEADMPPAKSDDRDRATYKQLQQAVAARSAELGLPDGVLASRRWLEALQDGEDWPGALSGWRRTELEPLLSPILATIGKA